MSIVYQIQLSCIILFQIQNDQAHHGSTHPVWQLITEGMFALYCQSSTDTLMFADQLNDKVAMTQDLQLESGDIVQFRVCKSISVDIYIV